jgi:outer membrane protein OmpA-like peptidoglycan-associated protein
MTTKSINFKNVAKIGVLIFAAITLLSTTLNAQSFGDRLKNAAKNGAENAAVRKVEQKTDEAINKGIDKATDPNSYKNDGKDDKQQEKQQQRQQDQPQQRQQDQPQQKLPNNSNGNISSTQSDPKNVKTVELTYAKSDFVSGDVIIFEDNIAGEKMGEFPSQWDLLQGNAEVAKFDGLPCIYLESPGTSIAPLMKNMKSYLPDVFTVELDYWVNNYTETYQTPSQNYRLHFYGTDNAHIMELEFAEGSVRWNYLTPDEDWRYGDVPMKEKIDTWSHLSVSFNKRAFKAYINGVRVVNIPNMAAPVKLSLNRTQYDDHRTAITNFRIAKGAVPLYDRMMTDGKIISYGITFDIGKSTIKPESMAEISRIAELMKENPELNFSVQGHTDNTGNATTNQTLSEERSKAVLNKLIEYGISKERLSAAGKGQNSPIADNSSDEGRAKNRRVEFVKM